MLQVPKFKDYKITHYWKLVRKLSPIKTHLYKTVVVEVAHFQNQNRNLNLQISPLFLQIIRVAHKIVMFSMIRNVWNLGRIKL